MKKKVVLKLSAGLTVFFGSFIFMYGWGAFGGLIALGYKEKDAVLVSVEAVYEKTIGTTTFGRPYHQVRISYQFYDQVHLCAGTRMRITGNGVSNQKSAEELAVRLVQQSQRNEFRVFVKGDGSCEAVVFRSSDTQAQISLFLAIVLTAAALFIHVKNR